jgi:hypothetical protein
LQKIVEGFSPFCSFVEDQVRISRWRFRQAEHARIVNLEPQYLAALALHKVGHVVAASHTSRGRGLRSVLVGYVAT